MELTPVTKDEISKLAISFNEKMELLKINEMDDSDVEDAIILIEESFTEFNKSEYIKALYKDRNVVLDPAIEPERESRRRFLNLIYKEFYKLVCTNDKEYKEIRKNFSLSFSQLVPIVATAIASPLGIAASLISGIIAALLMIMFKLPTNAWCEMNKHLAK